MKSILYCFRQTLVVGVSTLGLAQLSLAEASETSPAWQMLESIRGSLNESIFDNLGQLLLAAMLVFLILATGYVWYSIYQKKQKILLEANMKKLKEDQEKQRLRAMDGNQKRMWIRVPVHESVYFYNPLEPRPAHLEGFSTGTIVDISGGGMLLATNIPLSIGAVISLILELNEIRVEGVMAEVIRVQACADSDSYKYEYATKFTNIREGHRDSIIRWVLDEERKEIRMDKESGEAVTKEYCDVCGVSLVASELEQHLCETCHRMISNTTAPGVDIEK